ncbi:MAG: hypothetical protein WAS07_04310 [Micropruina sp.]|nr:hypothetical protein [Micropruina sp.]
MSDPRVRELIESNVGQFALPLYEGVTTGVAAAEAWVSGMAHGQDYPWLLSLAARAHMRDYWLDSIAGTGWTIEGRPELMGQTILVNRDHNVALRLIKENKRIHPGGVPVAGSNETRRRAWQQPPLPDIDLTDGVAALPDVAECLLLWDCAREAGSLTVGVRVVHTIGAGRYGQRVPIDLSFVVRPEGTLYEELGFAGDSQDDSLFPNIDEKENVGDSAG